VELSADMAPAEHDPQVASPGSGEGTASDLAVGIAQASLGFLLAGLGPAVVLLAAEVHQPREHLVWLSSAFGAGLLVVAAIGPMVMRAGAGLILRVAAIAVSLGLVAMATTRLLPLVSTGALLTGLGGALMVLVTPILIQGRTAAARLTRVNGIASATGICAPVAIGALEHLGVHGRLALLAPLPALLVVAIRRSVPSPGGRPSGTVRTPRLSAGRAITGWVRIVLAVSCEFCFVIWGVARIQDTGAATATAAALSSAFAIGMAVGRLAGIRLAGRAGVVLAGCLTAAAGTGLVYASQSAAVVTAGLAIAGLGTAVLYPVTLAQFVDTPGLSPRHSASLGALASGAAILAAPTLLAALDGVINLRVAFLLPIPVLAVLLILTPRSRT
jgi:MFS family permease